MIKKDFEIDRDSRLYPELLRQIPNPPKKLFCRGNPELLECRKVAVVGSRRYSLYGKQTALMIGKYFGKTELAVVSGLAAASTPLPTPGCWKREAAPSPCWAPDWIGITR